MLNYKESILRCFLITCLLVTSFGAKAFDFGSGKIDIPFPFLGPTTASPSPEYAQEAITIQVKRCGPLAGAEDYGVIVSATAGNETARQMYIIKGSAMHVCPIVINKGTIAGVAVSGCTEAIIRNRFANCKHLQIFNVEHADD